MDYLLRIIARIFFPKDGKAVTFRCVGCYGLGSLTSVRGKYGKKSELEDRRVILGNFPGTFGDPAASMPFRNGKKPNQVMKDPPESGESRFRIPPSVVKTVGEGGKPRSPRNGKRTLDTCTARSGYLGPYVRRRARKTAKSHGEPSTGVTPVDARMGEPIEVNPRCPF